MGQPGPSEGEFRWFLSGQQDRNDILVPEAAKLNRSNPSECHKAAVTVILPGFMGLVYAKKEGCISLSPLSFSWVSQLSRVINKPTSKK